MANLVERIASAFTESAEQRQQREDLVEKYNRIEVFPGSLKEFERLKQTPYLIIDTLESNKFVMGKYFSANLEFPSGMKLSAARFNATAVIRYTRTITEFSGLLEMGIPVRPAETLTDNQS